jgi:hypothetical protein
MSAHLNDTKGKGGSRLLVFVALAAVTGAFTAVACTATGCGSGSSAGPDTGDSSVADGPGSSGSSGGSSSGTSSSSGSMSDDGGDASPDRSTGSDGGDAGDGASSCGPYTAPMCGTQADAGPCDLHSSVCCVTPELGGRCLPKNPDGGGVCDPNMEVQVGCLSACECPGAQVCCGVLENLVVDTACQAVAQGGHCAPVMQTSTQASAQLCKVDSECVNGDPCIAQTCTLRANLNLCGLQTQSPFNCSPSDGGAPDGGEGGTLDGGAEGGTEGGTSEGGSPDGGSSEAGTNDAGTG